MFQAAIGHSDDVDAKDAVLAVVASCKAQLGAVTPKAGLLLCGAEMDHAVVLEELERAWPGVPMVGGSSGGEASNQLGFTEDSVLLLMLAGDEVEVGVGFGLDADKDVHAAAAAAVASAQKGLRGPPKVCISICEGDTVSPSEIVDALQQVLGPDVPVVGGAASCTLTRPGFARQFVGRKVFRGAVTVLLLGGRVRVGHGMACGWKPIGKTRTITKAQGNLLMELDGLPAADVYESYIGKVSEGSGVLFKHHPLAIQEPGNHHFYLRAAYARGPVPGSLWCAGHVPQGVEVRMTEADRSDVLGGAAESLALAAAMYGAGKPQLALMFSCALRRAVLGTWTEREVDLVRQQVGPDVPLMGFYSFGEFSPVEQGRPARVFNGTIVSLFLGGDP